MSVDPSDGNVYVATGNIAANPENTPWGDSVVRLTPDLQFVSGKALPVLIGDDDLGSTPMLFQAPGCPPQLAVEQKNGTRAPLRPRQHRGRAAPDADAVARAATWCTAAIPVHEFIGVTAYSPELNMVFVSNPTGLPNGYYTNGMVGYRINSSCAFTKVWNTTAGVKGYVVGTPTVANGVVYYADGGHDQVHAFNAQTGQELWNSGTDVDQADVHRAARDQRQALHGRLRQQAARLGHLTPGPRRRRRSRAGGDARGPGVVGLARPASAAPRRRR